MNQNYSSSDTIQSIEREQMQERRDLAVEFIFCLVLIEVLKQLPVHPGHDDLIKHIEDITFKHFKYREKFVKFYLLFIHEFLQKNLF